jgi:hypothetical protein
MPEREVENRKEPRHNSSAERATVGPHRSGSVLAFLSVPHHRGDFVRHRRTGDEALGGATSVFGSAGEMLEELVEVFAHDPVTLTGTSL